MNFHASVGHDTLLDLRELLQFDFLDQYIGLGVERLNCGLLNGSEVFGESLLVNGLLLLFLIFDVAGPDGSESAGQRVVDVSLDYFLELFQLS